MIILFTATYNSNPHFRQMPPSTFWLWPFKELIRVLKQKFTGNPLPLIQLFTTITITPLNIH
jgi:hypothetical protein